METALDTFTTYVTEGKSTLEHIINKSEAEKSEKSEKVKKGNVGDVLGKTLKNVRISVHRLKNVRISVHRLKNVRTLFID